MSTKRINLAGLAAIVALMAGVAPQIASAETLSEVESARANARAGGPTNARDAELLGWYGPTSALTRGHAPSSVRNYSAARHRRDR